MSIVVKVSIIGVLKRPNNDNDFEIELPANSTLGSLLHKLDYSEDHINYIIPIINGKKGHLRVVLNNDDESTLTLPVGGG